jgi:hypothetical protein
MVAAAIEQECEWAAKAGQVEHVGDSELGGNPGRTSAYFGLLDRQRSHVNAGHIEALLGQPDAIRARSATQVEGATGLNFMLTQHTLQLRGGPACIPWEIALPIAFVPCDGFCHG